MFTGLITDVGAIERVTSTSAGLEVRVRCAYSDLEPGESVALNGACLTVLDRGDGWFAVAAVISTLERTAIGTWSTGKRVNLERALAMGDRLGGHMVQGHVDGIARVARVRREADSLLIDLALGDGLQELMVPQGSIAVDGVSLTVNDLPMPDTVGVSIIDYTARQTTLGDLREGDSVHVEADIIGKYVQRLVAPYAQRGAASGPAV